MLVPTGVALVALLDLQILDREAVIRTTMVPYSGASRRAIPSRTMTGKVMCGYQGWFAAPGDGSEMGWFHWGDKNGFGPDNVNVEMWPDVSELDPDERFPTPFRHRDGRVAEVFSSYNRKTVMRHFRWMQEYGIDGVFVQRFATRIQKPVDLRFTTTVLGHCRAGANEYGRTYAVMYDLTALPKGGTQVVREDWKLLSERMRITSDPAYQRHRGKPVVAIWGIGFADGRAYTLDECLELVEFFKRQHLTVMIGVPTYWRTLNVDCLPDPKVHQIAEAADIVSPWTVGRFKNVEEVRDYAERRLREDIAWCTKRFKELMPVVYPGFSWQNLYPGDTFDKIPRREGRFLWTQYAEAKAAGATMIYQAMFDEVDEGTAIFKVTDNPPVGPVRFLALDGPSDQYLWLVGQAARMIRGETRVWRTLPTRPREAPGAKAGAGGAIR